jgi:hypothetical protein
MLRILVSISRVQERVYVLADEKYAWIIGTSISPESNEHVETRNSAETGQFNSAMDGWRFCF